MNASACLVQVGSGDVGVLSLINHKHPGPRKDP